MLHRNTKKLTYESLRSHSVYDPCNFADMPSITRLLYYGMAAERFVEPYDVTVTVTKSFEDAIKLSRITPTSFVTKKFNNANLGYLRRVGLLEFGSNKSSSRNPDAEPTLHVHMVIDMAGQDIETVRSKLETVVFNFGSKYIPRREGAVTQIRPFDPTSVLRSAPPPMCIYESGLVGWFMYAAKGARTAYKFFGRSTKLSVRNCRRFGKFTVGHDRPLQLNDIHFPNIIFIDEKTKRKAEMISKDERREEIIRDRIKNTMRLLNDDHKSKEPGICNVITDLPVDIYDETDNPFGF